MRSKAKSQPRRRAAPRREPAPASIAVVARRTGLSADTLRIWERRYGFPQPSRNAMGTRMYSSGDVARLVLISRALKSGYRPSEIVGESDSELERLLAKPTEEQAPPNDQVREIVDLVAGDEPARLRAALRRAAALAGARRFVAEIAAPLCDRVGELWASGELEIRQEHLFTERMRTELRNMTSTLEGGGRGLAVLATFQDERHSLGLEMAALYLATHGFDAHVLGPDLPPEEIARAARALGAAVVGLSVSDAANPRETEKQLALLQRSLPARVWVWVGGRGARAITTSNRRLATISDWSEVDREVMRLERGK
jgi:DNA-binding transcriptional MerR regulator